MPFVVFEGITVEAALQQQTSTQVEVGDRVRAFDGTVLSSIRARYNEWRIVQVPVLRAAADTLVAALNSPPPHSASGDIFGGAITCHGVLVDLSYRKYAPGEHVIVTFDVRET